MSVCCALSKFAIGSSSLYGDSYSEFSRLFTIVSIGLRSCSVSICEIPIQINTIKITINIITGATETNAEPRLLASVATLNTIPSFKRMA